jgi:nitrile hydratase accessory protein
MTNRPDPEVANMEGAAALPRKNGELVFDELWEGRIFGLAAALHGQGAYPWRTFRDALVDRIAAADAAADGSTYYERFLRAFEDVAVARGLVTPEELTARTEEYASGARDDFDHDDDDHDHGHDHHH